jgi:hypothetical protein
MRIIGLTAANINERRRAIAGSCVKVRRQNASANHASAKGHKLRFTRPPNDGPSHWGTGGREFKSPRSDQLNQRLRCTLNSAILAISSERES